MNKFLLLLAFLVSSALGFAQPLSYRLDKMMGTPVSGPNDLAVDPSGNIYMLNSGGITKLDSTGRCMTSYATSAAATQINYPQTMGVDGAGNVFVSSYLTSAANSFIRKYDRDGNLLLQFGSVGNGPGQFQEVHGMCVDAAGRVYVAEYNGLNSRMQCFDNQCNMLFEFRMPNATYNTHLVDVDVDAAGNIYLLEEGFAVTKLNAAGQLLARMPLTMSGRTWASYERTSALLVDAAGNFIVTASQQQVMLFSAAGAYIRNWTSISNFSSSTNSPLARDAAGRIYASIFTHQVFDDHLYKFSSAGVLLKRWGNLTTLSHVRQDEAGNVYTLNNGVLHKYTATGQEVLTFTGAGDGGLALDAAGNIYVLATSDLASTVYKYNPQGIRLNIFQSFGITAGSYQLFSGLAVDGAGNMYLADYYGCCVRKLNAQGVFQGTMGTRGTGAGQLYIPKAVAVDLRGNVYVADYDGRRVQKFSPTGQVLRQFGPSSPFAQPSVTVCDVDLAVDGPGNVYLASSVHNGQIFAADGSWQTAMPAYGSRLAVNRRGTRVLTMVNRNDVIKFFSSTQVRPENLISGQIFHDLNNNCLKEATEPAIPGIVVTANPGNYYGITDENGAYVVAVDTGRYTMQQLVPTDEAGWSMQQSCAANSVVSFRGYGNSITNVDFGNQANMAPYLRLSVSSNRRRRCARNLTTVTYGNNGYAASPTSTAVTVALPPQVVFISASRPHTRDAQGNYVFAVGALQPNQGGTITIQDSVVCGDPTIRGLTVCTRASISPPNTYPPPPNWNRASVSVSGRSQVGNIARFVLRNNGTGVTTDSLALRVYQNSELALQHNYSLAAGDSLVLRVPGSQPVVRVEADQPAGHPTQRIASSNVELRGLSTPGQPNPTMNAQFPSMPNPQTAEDCQPILDSYDPNDKQVSPTGVTAQHYTPTGIPLRYRVRFQNTGSDDAYRVEVVDTLAANLDPRTLRVETASHPYRLAVSGRGRLVLTFTFDNINLPPRTRDEVGSNGFLQFSIQPKAALPDRALVENFADIFFDYNPPVRTNTTDNRLHDMPAVVVPSVALSYPAVLASPLVSRFTPAQGRAGTLVTITGQRFGSTLANNQVRFNGVTAPVLSATANTLTARVPAGATTGTIQVITGEGAARSTQLFTVYQPPTITAVTPAEGIPGSVITLTGTHFSAVSAQDTVWFNGVPAVVQQASSTALQVVVPAGALSGRIRLNTLGGTVNSPQDFTVWYPPTITSFSPARGKAGDVITLTGSNFAPANRNTVAFGTGTAVVLAATGTSLQVRVPAGAQTAKVRVQTPGGAATSAADFTFWPVPVITSFNPTQGTVGEMINLVGQNFLVDGRADSLYVGGVRAAVLAATATSATIRVPKSAMSGPLAAAGTGGRSESIQTFTVLDLTPTDAITVYPNPAHGALTLDWLRADFALEQVQVYNAVGSLVASADLSHQAQPSLQLDFASNAPGLYLLVVRTSRGMVVKRVVLY